MAVFLIASLVLAVLALGYVLHPLWRSRPLVGATVLASLAAAGALLYTLVGTPNALDPAQRHAPETLGQAIAQLEAELKRDPNQIEGWQLLARAYIAEGRTAPARDALARAAKLAPDNADLLTEAAEARARASDGNRFDAEAVAMLKRALSQQPMHQRARWFLGIAQRQARQPAEAAKTWEPLLAVVDAKTGGPLREQIDAARQEAGLPPLPTAAASAAPRGITVKVELAPALAAQLPAGATLFVIAREPDGSPIPVAVERLPASGFPLTVRLDDGDSLMPTKKLSALAKVALTARVSASGDATGQRGDLEAATVTATLGEASPVTLRIDRVRAQ